MNMKTMSSREVQNAFGSFLDTTQHEPVMVTRRNRPVGVMFSMNDLPGLVDLADSMREEITAGVKAGLADAEAGKGQELTDEYINELVLKTKDRISTNPDNS